MAAEGIPTVRGFDKDRTVSLRLVQAVAAVPEGFGAVAAIRPAGPGKVVISAGSGIEVTAAIDWNFVL